MSSNIRGALFMTGSMTAFTVNDAFIKLIGVHLPFFQVLFLRSLAVTILMAVLTWALGGFRSLPGARDRRLILIRTVAEILAAYFFLTALFNMPIANATAVIQALPLTVTLGAALFFGEGVGWRRWLAIWVGLIGVLLIIQPGSSGFSIYSVYVVIAVICVTVRDLAARRISASVPSPLVAFAAVIGVLVFSAVGAIFVEWEPMGPTEGLYLAVSVVSIICAYLFSVSAMRVGEVSYVAQFRYTSLLAALLLGLVMFGEWPDALTLVGAAIVVATGLITLWRDKGSAPQARGFRVR